MFSEPLSNVFVASSWDWECLHLFTVALIIYKISIYSYKSFLNNFVLTFLGLGRGDEIHLFISVMLISMAANSVWWKVIQFGSLLYILEQFPSHSWNALYYHLIILDLYVINRTNHLILSIKIHQFIWSKFLLFHHSSLISPSPFSCFILFLT